MFNIDSIVLPSQQILSSSSLISPLLSRSLFGNLKIDGASSKKEEEEEKEENLHSILWGSFLGGGFTFCEPETILSSAGHFFFLGLSLSPLLCLFDFFFVLFKRIILFEGPTLKNLFITISKLSSAEGGCNKGARAVRRLRGAAGASGSSSS